MVQRLVLASTSPRRRELITHLGLDFVPASVDVDESPLSGEAPATMVQRLARTKGLAVAVAFPDDVVVAADTTVELDHLILGKPNDTVDAVRMLRLLRGRSHRVFTGVAIAHGTDLVMQVQETVVWMRDYSDEEIHAYCATGDPLDKAAAYAIQHPFFHPVERLEGCYANVMGLPLCRVYVGLKHFRVNAPKSFLSGPLESECPFAREILATQ